MNKTNINLYSKFLLLISLTVVFSLRKHCTTTPPTPQFTTEDPEIKSHNTRFENGPMT